MFLGFLVDNTGFLAENFVKLGFSTQETPKGEERKGYYIEKNTTDVV